MTTTAERRTTISTSPPSTPRLSLAPNRSGRTLLDGGWWPRSTDPVAELPGLILALDGPRRPVTHLILATAGWDSRPRRLGVAGRVVRLGWFTSQPVSLLTATRGDRDRVDLLIIPPDTPPAAARAAMAIASQPDNTIHAPDILPTVTGRQASPAATARPADTPADSSWESEGGHLRRSNAR